MLRQTRGLPKSKNFIIGLMTLMLFAGLFAGEFTFSLDIEGNQNGIIQRVMRTTEAAGTEREESDNVEEIQQLERAVLEMLLDELEEEQLQEVMEVLESWIRDNPGVCPELRAVVENALEEQGQGEVSRENASGYGNSNNNANNNANNSNANNSNANSNDVDNNNGNNNNGNNNTNPPTGLSPGEGDENHPSLDEGGFNVRPSVTCDNSYWVANTRPVYMVGTPGFWTPRHRCRLCGFTTTCIREAIDHSENYQVKPPSECNKLCECGKHCKCVGCDGQPLQVPTWMFDHDSYYKYTPRVPGAIIHVPDGTYICVNCGKIKHAGTSPSGEK